jgi:quercetin dioxygenase-like cupin family protein
MSPTDRLREHPEDRLAAPLQLVDLADAGARLRGEPHGSVSGHRQIAVFRHGPVTLLLFRFEPDGLLPEHRAEGVVTIHLLSGRLVVIADDDPHQLEPGQLLGLAPGVVHSVRATAASEMLLTIHQTPSDG